MSKIVRPDPVLKPLDPETRARLRAFARDEITWAEVEGLTFERARSIARIGCDLAAAGRLEEARVIFTGLVAMNPKDSGAAAALGTVLHKLGRADEARQAYDDALSADPKNPVALGNRGELRLAQGDAKGVDDLIAAVKADPQLHTAAARRARAMLKAALTRQQQRNARESAGASSP
jgi:Flp pilus assembly protein TadD